MVAILGGQLAQDVINVLGHKQQPIQNMVIFDGNSMESLTFPLHPEGQLGASLLSLDAGQNGGAMNVGGMMGMGMGGDISMGGTAPQMMGLPILDPQNGQQQPLPAQPPQIQQQVPQMSAPAVPQLEQQQQQLPNPPAQPTKEAQASTNQSESKDNTAAQESTQPAESAPADGEAK